MGNAGHDESEKAMLETALAAAEARASTQRRRIEKLAVEGNDAESIRLAEEVLDQLNRTAQILGDLLKEMSGDVLAHSSASQDPARAIINVGETESLAHWALHFSISVERLKEIIAEVGPAAADVARYLDRAALVGLARKSRT